MDKHLLDRSAEPRQRFYGSIQGLNEEENNPQPSVSQTMAHGSNSRPNPDIVTDRTTDPLGTETRRSYFSKIGLGNHLIIF